MVTSQIAKVLSGLKVMQYALKEDIFLCRCRTLNPDVDKWAIRRYGYVFGRLGRWTMEPQPSSRDEAFFAEYRFDSEAEALDCWQQHNGRLGYF